MFDCDLKYEFLLPLSHMDSPWQVRHFNRLRLIEFPDIYAKVTNGLLWLEQLKPPHFLAAAALDDADRQGREPGVQAHYNDVKIDLIFKASVEIAVFEQDSISGGGCSGRRRRGGGEGEIGRREIDLRRSSQCWRGGCRQGGRGRW